MQQSREITVKCVMVGDGGVGKTSLMVTYAQKECPRTYVPTVFDNYTAKVVINTGDGESINVLCCLFDTAGQEDYSQLRRLTYPNTNVFVITFSVVQYSSFENVKNKWYAEIKDYIKEGSFAILVGTQVDLRDGNIKQVVTKEMGDQMAKDIKCACYMETSAYLNFNVTELINFALVTHINNLMRTHSKHKCAIL